MTEIIFVTGTDTDVGKTRVSVELMRALKQQKCSVIGMKPVSTGGFTFNKKKASHDAISLWNETNVDVDYPEVNPFVFLPPTSPDIAAAMNNVKLDAPNIYEKVHTMLRYKPDVLVIEGVGGWMTPINEKETMADVVLLLQQLVETFQQNKDVGVVSKLQILLVVKVKLGCINHAVLTNFALHSVGINCSWVANCFDTGMEEHYEIEYLKTLRIHLNSDPIVIMRKNSDYSELFKEGIKRL